MKNRLGLILFFLTTVAGFGQGSVYFNNRVPGEVDARVVLPDGTGAGAGWIAQLFIDSGGGQLTPLQPSTTFRTSSQAAMGYVESVDMTIPGVAPGAQATFVMRAFNGPTFETSTLRYQSNPFTLRLGGGLLPPVNLVGLQSFTQVPLVSAPVISVPPESQTLTLGSTVILRVEATGTGPFTYQWFKNGEPIAGATGTSLTLGNITGFDAGNYSVTVSNSAGSTTSQTALLSLPLQEDSGAVVFNNRVVGVLDVRVILPDGTPAGAGWTAQLYGGPEGGTLNGLFPATTFRTTSDATLGYVAPVDVTVPGVRSGARATLVMRVFNGETFETSALRLESNPFTVAVGGGILPPANLAGLSSFHVVSDAKPFVARELPGGYSPGARLLVVLKASPENSVKVYAIEDAPPAQWAIGQISDGGTYDGATKKVKFGPFFDGNARTLTYEVIPPANESGQKQFSGTASADGLVSPIGGNFAVEPAVLHPADNDPADSRMGIAEVTAYGSAWRTGRIWVSGPNPIHIDFVTRAAALWKNGEAYRLDSSIAGPPLWWVNLPGVGPATPNGGRSVRLASVAGDSRAIGRHLDKYVPGDATLIQVAVEPAAHISAYAVQDQIPAGWTVVRVSDGGDYDAVNGQVKWGPFFDSTPRVLSYEALAPEGASTPVAFGGVASFDGETIPVAGQRQAKPASRLKGLSVGADGKLKLEVTGHTGTKVYVEGSSDLTDWVRVDATVNADGSISFNDPAAIDQGLRFYRVAVE